MAEIADPENTLIITLKGGDVVVQMLPDVAPKHVEQIKALVRGGEYDNVAFHRVIDGFMAQTGDVENGDMEDGFNIRRAGTGDRAGATCRRNSRSCRSTGACSGWRARRRPIAATRSSSSCSRTGISSTASTRSGAGSSRGWSMSMRSPRRAAEQPGPDDRRQGGGGRMIRRGIAVLALALGIGAAPIAALAVEPGNTLVIEVGGAAAGTIEIELLPELAPKHVAQIKQLAAEGAYDGVAFHRVIEGFMAQTGDVEFGTQAAFAQGRAGTGGSKLPNLPAEFSDVKFERGTVGMARAQDPDSANSQFFIMFAPAPFLDGEYTVVGQVISGMEVVDAIKRGEGPNGAVDAPDVMTSVTVK